MGVTARTGRRFRDRVEAGDALATAVAARLEGVDPASIVVLGLPRGGVPVAAPVARRLGAELDVLVVRKLGAPHQPELAIGAVATGDVLVLDEDLAARLAVRRADVDRVLAREREELARREAVFRGGRPPLAVAGRNVIVVDDGIATGATTRAAVQAVRALAPASVVVAAPTASRRAIAVLAEEADDVIVVDAPDPYLSVGWWYEEFTQTTDDEVREVLDRSRS